MDTVKFIKMIENYYGIKYRSGMLSILIGYLEKQTLDLNSIFQKVVLDFSGQYKTLPDIAIFEKIIKVEKKYMNKFMIEDSSTSKTSKDMDMIRDLIDRTYDDE